MNVLVVDDEPFALQFLGHQLRGLGVAEVRSCSSAPEALMVLTSAGDDIGLVCCDLQMPGMDGVEFIRHLPNTGYRGAVALVSGEDKRILQAAERLALAHGLDVVGSLPKPVQPEQLRRVLAAVQSRNTVPKRGHDRVYTPEELAVALREGQLVTWFQPQVELATGRVVAMETLVRWQHPEDGMIPPAAFTGVAEDSGLIDALTRVVLTAALRHAADWERAGHPLTVSVNVSMDNLGELEFPDFVAFVLNQAGISAARLVLEVTESRLMKDPRAPLEILTRLRLRRVRISIDDFGTGYSSLAQLRDIPFDELKIDRRFVRHVARQPATRAIFDASLAMARDLGMTAVGEGVEERAEWDFLREAGCDLAQGYFIARPMPPEAVLPWLEEWAARVPELVQAPPPPAAPARRPSSLDEVVDALRDGALALPSVDPHIADLRRLVDDPKLGPEDVAALVPDSAFVRFALHFAAARALGLRTDELPAVCAALGARRVYAITVHRLLSASLRAEREPWSTLLAEAVQGSQAATAIAMALCRPPLNSDDLVWLAMAHNVGVATLVVLADQHGLAAPAPEVLDHALLRHHEEVGALAARAWGLPADAVRMAGLHHRPGPLGERMRATIAAGVALAAAHRVPTPGHRSDRGLGEALGVLGIGLDAADETARGVHALLRAVDPPPPSVPRS